MNKHNLKQWYVNLGPGIMLAGILLYAGSFIVAAFYKTGGIDIYRVPNHPLVWVCCFGMLLICIGGGSFLFIFSEYDENNQ